MNYLEKAAKAAAHYGPYSSPHEVLGVLEEEFLELKQAIHANDWKAARAEAGDIAAVCIRFERESTIREDEGQI